MNLQNTKVFNAIPPALKDDAAFVANVIDSKGMAYVEFIVTLGAIDVSATVLKVMASDTMSGATTLGGTPELVKDTTTKPGPSDDGKVIIVGVNLVKKPNTPRYLQLQATADDGTTGILLGAIALAEVSGEVASDQRGDDVLGVDYA